VFDNVERWIGTRSLESQLVGLYEQLGASGGRIVVTSQLSVNEIDFALAYLESRMRLFSRYELKPLSSDERIRLFSDIAADRGIEIAREVIEYLQKRIDRSQGNLLATLDFLDHESIVEQRRITVPFIKKALKL
jgi:DnaA family protein